MADDPVVGFDDRITKRARSVCTALLAYPIVVIAFEYAGFLIQQGTTLPDAIAKARADMLLLAAPLAGTPLIAFNFFREIQIHIYLDKILGTKHQVGSKIVSLMRELASSAGYASPERITAQPDKAMEWFYSYINAASVTRSRAFEIWEGYYVGLYISVASILSAALCIYVAIISTRPWIATTALLPMTIFLLIWAHRRFHVIPNLMKVPVQQVRDLSASGEVLSEAKRRFD